MKCETELLDAGKKLSQSNQMNTPQSFRAVSALLLAFSFNASADEITRLEIRRTGPWLEINWPAIVEKSDGSIIQPYFELQRSADFQQWQPIGERQRAATATPGQLLGVTLGTDEPHAFYRLLSIEPRDIAKLGTGGAEVFGYGDAFAQELKRIGQISPEEFAAMFPTTTNYLSAISWDPTTAPFWNEFNVDPDKVNAGKNPDQSGYRFFDNRLSPDEMAVFKKNGFVVIERLGMRSFADAFYRLWKDDLPVFISTDALLQAWHRTYDAMLEEVEETYLFNSMQAMLDAMAGQVDAASTQVGNGVLKDSLLDADYFLAVARSLLAGTKRSIPAARKRMSSHWLRSSNDR